MIFNAVEVSVLMKNSSSNDDECLLALWFITLKLTSVRMWWVFVFMACLWHIWLVKNIAIWTWVLCVFLTAHLRLCTWHFHVFVALWQYGFAPSLSKGFHVHSWQGLQGHSRGPYLSDWTGALAFSFYGFVLFLLMQTHPLAALALCF